MITLAPLGEEGTARVPLGEVLRKMPGPTAGRTGKPVSMETRRKIGDANRGRGKGKPWPPARREAQRRRAP